MIYFKSLIGTYNRYMSNQFKTLRRTIARQVDDSILDELDDVDEVVDDVEVEEVNVVNEDFNVNIVAIILKLNYKL
jgi:hypothetical protein